MATVLTKKTDRRLRVVAGATLLVVAGAASVQSWAHLTHLAQMSGVSSSLSGLFAISVDGLVLSGLLLLLHSTLAGRRSVFAWVLLLLGSLLTVVGNAASSPSSSWTSVVVFVVPALVLVLSTEAFLSMLRSSWVAKAVEQEQKTAAAEREAVKVARADARRTAREQALTNGQTDRVAVYTAALALVPREVALTVRAVALLRAHEQMFGSTRVRLADAAEALAVEPAQATKAMERARAKMREPHSAKAQPLLAAV